MVTASASRSPNGARYRRMPFGRLVIAATLAALAVACAGGFDAGGAISILDRPTARTVWFLLDVLRMPVFLDGTTLMHPAGFGMRIEPACTALVPVLTIAACLIALPLTRARVLGGLVAGSALLCGLNSARLAGLYYIGVYSPRHFAVAHDWFGQTLMVASILIFLVFWSKPRHGTS